MPRRWDDRWQRWEESVPIPVEGGLTTSRQRGAMAEQWWSKRFVEVLDSYGLGARMQRGRRYARAGQVLSLDVRPGQILAQVQGSQRTPYLVVVEPAPIDAAGWASVDAALASRVVFAARLLAGEVPPELDAVFSEVGVPLLPRRWADLSATCSCPDPENPCKHLAAVLYVFADRLDDDPWLLLTWRGRRREQVLAALAATGSAAGAGSAPAAAGEVAPWWPLTPGSAVAAGSHREGPAGGELPPGAPPDQPAAVLARLDDLAADVGAVGVIEKIAAAYPTITGVARTD